MMQTNQKVIRIGSSAGVTIPAKELRKQDIDIGDEVEVTIRSLKTNDKYVDPVRYAEQILQEYRQDFVNLAKK